MAKQNTSTSNETESPISTLKMPEFEPGKQYDSEFYNLFIQNQNLLEQVELEAKDRNDV